MTRADLDRRQEAASQDEGGRDAAGEADSAVGVRYFVGRGVLRVGTDTDGLRIEEPETRTSVIVVGALRISEDPARPDTRTAAFWLFRPSIICLPRSSSTRAGSSASVVPLEALMLRERGDFDRPAHHCTVHRSKPPRNPLFRSEPPR